MNHLENIQKLNNNYYSFRHGHALNNEKCIINSEPMIGIYNYELTSIGIREVRASVLKAIDAKILNKDSIIVSSDFLRTVEGAIIGQKYSLGRQPVTTPKLRERNFGDFEGKSNLYYEDVWANDLKDADHHIDHVESVNEVQTRTTSLIAELERNFAGHNILLSSHGDVLQILETGFRKIPANLHRSLPHLNNAEIRKLTLT